MNTNSIRRAGAGRVALLGLSAALAFGAGCSKDHELADERNPIDPYYGGVSAPVPSGLAAEVGSRRVQLTWELADSSHVGAVAKYRIYRRSGVEEAELTDSTTTSPATVRGLVNGQIYRFSVASVLANGLEGKRSEEISAVAAVFGIVIEDGRDATASTSVRLTFEAPDGTSGLQIANDGQFDGIAVQPFAATRNWEVPPGDGAKTVWARFLDAEGNPSVAVSDGIELDTRAEIAAVSFSPTTNLRPGQTVHFLVDGNESYGTALVELGEGGRRLALRDDGGGGDPTANDGIYELNYVIEEDVELDDALVTASFSDRVGNDAASRIAPTRLSIHRDPEAVVLDPLISPSPQELLLSWSQSSDAARFQLYRVYRAEAVGVDTSRTRSLVEESNNRTNTTFTDANLDPNKTYYYRVYVVDPFGNQVSSNERSGRPQANAAPDPVVLNPAFNVTEDGVSLSWSRSTASDFSEYRVYRGKQSNLDSDPERRLLSSISDAGTTSFDDDAEIEENRTYYYRLDVVDRLGAVGRSNVVSATTLDRLPQAVTLDEAGSVGETAVLLNWSRNSERDFARYELRRSTNAGVSPTSPLLTSASQAEATSFLDTGLTENTEYFYRVFVVDRGGNVVGSNELAQTTLNADPPAIALNLPTEVSGAQTPSVALSWTQSGAHDFEAYRIYRDTAPSVGESSSLIRTIDSASTLAFTETGLEDNTRYYFRIFVRDDADGSTGSNEQSIVTANRAPRPVNLTVSGTTTRSISLSWTENTNSDFVEYRLLQGTNSTSFPTVVASFTQAEQTAHTVFVDENDTTVYFFKVETYDQAINSTQRLKSDSNVVSAQVSTP
ncbi:MAG: fibronectin type III domain-containing protein [Candidatus Eisenbacteria bacterium]|nr:fibronectin type III domain-containing protein [Candidatus Eisenbacteria bacterium]